MRRYIVIHYAEIGLKGRNRGLFERQLQRNVRERLAGLDVAEVERLSGRLLVWLGAEVDPSSELRTSPSAGSGHTVAAVIERLRTVPGIAYFAPAYGAPKDVAAIKAAVVEALGERSYQSFKTAARRADKSFPLTSPEINAEVGGHVQAATGWAVDLKDPELVIHIEVLFKKALFYFERINGVGGLPVGVGGTAGLLLSGGIDSPVGLWLVMKRGSPVVPVYFDILPFADEATTERALKVAEVLFGWAVGFPRKVYVVQHGENLKQIMETNRKYSCLLCKRMLSRVAERNNSSETS